MKRTEQRTKYPSVGSGLRQSKCWGIDHNQLVARFGVLVLAFGLSAMPVWAAEGKLGLNGQVPSKSSAQDQELEARLERKSEAMKTLAAARRDLEAAQRAAERRPSESKRSSPSDGSADALEAARAKVRAAEAAMAAAETALVEEYRSVRQSVSGATRPERIQAGDFLEVFLREDESINGTYQVWGGGYILLPKVGRVFVAGLDPMAAEKAVKQAIELELVREATVVVERKLGAAGPGLDDGRFVYLAGEFARPGILRFSGANAPTLLGAVLQSGGYSEYADLSRVRLLRMAEGQEVLEELNVERILEGKGLSGDLVLKPGDILVMPPRQIIIYVTGNVVQPGAVKFRSGEQPAAYEAVLRSGGFNRFANIRKAYVLREIGRGEKQRLNINFSQVQKAREVDLNLQAGDILVVPERLFSF